MEDDSMSNGYPNKELNSKPKEEKKQVSCGKGCSEGFSKKYSTHYIEGRRG